MKSNNKEATQLNSTLSQPWWNRPLWGNQSIWERLKGMFIREPIPESSIFLHDRALAQLKKIAPLIEGVNDAKFGHPEFILLLKMRASFNQGLGEYKGLKENSEMVKAALDAKDSFLTVEETEFQYRSYTQQNFYEEIFKLLDLFEKDLMQEDFHQAVENLAEQTTQKLKTEEGVQAIQSYSKELQRLSSEHKLALRLLYLFKRYELTDFSILKKISELVSFFEKEELHDPKQVLIQIKVNYGIFEKLGEIIGITGKKNNPDTYTKIIQYIALMEKHKDSYSQFKRLLSYLKEWQDPYETVVTLREEYPAKVYKLPKTFREEIPGLSLYEKYKSSLILLNEK
ncbi:hypothetical protein PCC7418_0629 [Halothece sp. PCC 7418]|uniref:hypothetical protein n=1 Tax=Halothece sp. (strain PCC 7418) TaxID=65093 RepID=UPI0002A0645F|nr:hypothetical protein [Halothece sp. PCC 7418]AFZ42854.1 hypothetical protein PCC7418_0629 [Halothece sp. PCC 7418]